jgi:tetrahydromethanopterin S-methyltransferase subunit G
MSLTTPRPPAEDGRMEVRVTKLETDVVEIRERLIRIETRLEQTATKEDVERMGTTIVKWCIGLMFGFTTSTIVVMTFVLNYAAPPQGRFAKAELASVAAAPSQLPPIIINMPPGALQWQPAPEGAQPSPRKP